MGMLYAVLGLKNPNAGGRFLEIYNADPLAATGKEYRAIGLFFGSIFSCLRTSLGDFPIFEGVAYLNRIDSYTFWLLWLIIIVVTNIVFLNFIIAEASASYERIS